MAIVRGPIPWRTLNAAHRVVHHAIPEPPPSILESDSLRYAHELCGATSIGEQIDRARCLSAAATSAFLNGRSTAVVAHVADAVGVYRSAIAQYRSAEQWSDVGHGTLEAADLARQCAQWTTAAELYESARLAYAESAGPRALGTDASNLAAAAAECAADMWFAAGKYTASAAAFDQCLRVAAARTDLAIRLQRLAKKHLAPEVYEPLMGKSSGLFTNIATSLLGFSAAFGFMVRHAARALVAQKSPPPAPYGRRELYLDSAIGYVGEMACGLAAPIIGSALLAAAFFGAAGYAVLIPIAQDAADQDERVRNKAQHAHAAALLEELQRALPDATVINLC